LISFEEKKSAAPGKTLPFDFALAVAVEILISNFKGNIDATPTSTPSGCSQSSDHLWHFYRPLCIL